MIKRLPLISLFSCLIIFLLMLAACGDKAAIPTAEPTATATAAATVAPTDTPQPTATTRPTVTATAKPTPILTATAKPTTVASPAAGTGTIPGAATTPGAGTATGGAAPIIAGGKFYVEVEQSRSLANKKLDEMNNALDELRAQVISSDWEKARASWKIAHLAFLGARPLTPQILINDLYGNMDAQLDERPKYGFQVMEELLFSKTVKPSKDTALPIAARLVRDGRQARILMTKSQLNALTVFRGLRNICGGMAEFLGEGGPNYLSDTSVSGSTAKMDALKQTYDFFSPTTERLNPEVNKKFLDEVKTVDRLLVGTPDPHTVDLAAKKMQKALDDVSEVLKVDPLLEGPDLLQELGNLRVAVDGALVALAANKPDELAAQYSEFEVGWEGKVGRSVREVDDSDFQAIDTLRRSINEALYYGVKADTQRANQDLIDLAKALDRTVANVRKIPFTPGANK